MVFISKTFRCHEVGLTPKTINTTKQDQGIAAALSKTSLTTIGTCRVNNPCAAGARLYPYELCNQALYGFVHSTTEILQQIRHMRGVPIPTELAPLISDRLNVPQHGGADVYFVEISSRKSIKIGNFYLQQNQVQRCFGTRRVLWSIMRTYRRPEMKVQRLSALQQNPLFATVTEVEREFLTQGQIEYQTEDDIKSDMAQILDALEGSVVFVTHCNVPGKNGDPIADRERTVAAVENAARELMAEVYNPIPLVLEYDVSKSMTDVNHYSDDFLDVIAKDLYTTASNIMKRPNSIFLLKATQVSPSEKIHNQIQHEQDQACDAKVGLNESLPA